MCGQSASIQVNLNFCELIIKNSKSEKLLGKNID